MPSKPMPFGAKSSGVSTDVRPTPSPGVRWILTWVVVLAVGVAFWVGVGVALSGAI